MIKYIRFFAFCISSFRSECWRVRVFPMYFRWPLFVMCPVHLYRFLFFYSSVDKSPELFIFYVQYSLNRVLLHLKREDGFILISFTYDFFFFVLIIKEKICIHDNSAKNTRTIASIKGEFSDLDDRTTWLFSDFVYFLF